MEDLAEEESAPKKSIADSKENKAAFQILCMMSASYSGS
jgi:hypothetical protein